MFWRSCASSTWQPDQQSTVPRNIPYVYFSAILGTQNCEKCPPHRSGNGTLFRIFVPPNSVRFCFFVPNVSVWNVGNSGRAMAATFCTRPSLKQQPSNQKQQNKHSTTLLVVTLARQPWVSVLEIWNTHLRHTGYLVLTAGLHIIAITMRPRTPSDNSRESGSNLPNFMQKDNQGMRKRLGRVDGTEQLETLVCGL